MHFFGSTLFFLAKAKSTPSASTNFTIHTEKGRSSRSHRRPHRRWALIWMPHLIILAKCPRGSWTRAELELGSIFSFDKFNPITDLSVSSSKLASFRDNPGTPCGWVFPPSFEKKRLEWRGDSAPTPQPPWAIENLLVLRQATWTIVWLRLRCSRKIGNRRRFLAYFFALLFSIWSFFSPFPTHKDTITHTANGNRRIQLNSSQLAI